MYCPLSEQTIKSEYKHVDEDRRRYAISRGRKYQQGIVKRVYLDTHPGVAIGNLWSEKELTMQGRDDERTGFPTQKPLALLKRIIEASSNPGDIVLDPFCGCATTCIAAEALQRQWIGINFSAKVVELVKMRPVCDLDLTEYEGLLGHKVIHRTDIPTRLQPEMPRQIRPETLFGIKDMSTLETYQKLIYCSLNLTNTSCFGCRKVSLTGVKCLSIFAV